MTDRQRAAWEAGAYGEIAPTLESASLALVDRLEIAEGQEVLDVACGTGNAAIPAARSGASVIGLDLVPALLDQARGRASAAAVEVEFIEGDAERLPFEDNSFDRVISVFGVMFAPDQPRAAAELVRVCRAGGLIGVCAWTPEGLNGKLFALLGSRLPPPGPGFTPPTLWGSEDRIRELFADAGSEPEFERRSVVNEAGSVAEWVDFHTRSLPPLLALRPALEAAGQWEAVIADMTAAYEEANQATDGTLQLEAEYLLSVVAPAA